MRDLAGVAFFPLPFARVFLRHDAKAFPNFPTDNADRLFALFFGAMAACFWPLALLAGAGVALLRSEGS